MGPSIYEIAVAVPSLILNRPIRRGPPVFISRFLVQKFSVGSVGPSGSSGSLSGAWSLSDQPCPRPPSGHRETMGALPIIRDRGEYHRDTIHSKADACRGNPEMCIYHAAAYSDAFDTSEARRRARHHQSTQDRYYSRPPDSQWMVAVSRIPEHRRR